MPKYRKFNILSQKKNCCGPTVGEAVSNFLMSKKSMNCTKKTVRSYTDTLKPFQTFCDLQGVKNLADIDNFFVDNYFADMADKGHSDGGMHAYYRSLRTFMRWSWNVYNFDSICPILVLHKPSCGI